MLIDSLVQYRKRKGHDITVVFDGWKTGQGKETQAGVGGIRVIYSMIGERADAVIKRMVSSEKRAWIVITSDRDIADHAWAAGSVPVPAGVFSNILERAYNPYFSEQYGEEDFSGPHSKGNPRKPSKKEKALKRALLKL